MRDTFLKVVVFFSISVCIGVLSSGIGLFWDNVLFAAKMGNQLYRQGIFNWDIPAAFDPGHPPFLATLMALGWTLFGKTLAVSHAMMLPFVMGLLWQLYAFVSHFVVQPAHRFWAMLFVCADPTLLSQLVLVNPDVVLLFFFFMAINGMLNRRWIWQVIGLAGLGIVSYRGMMVCAGVFLVDMFLHLWVERGRMGTFITKRRVATYALGALPALLFVGWRLLTKGWLIANPMANWGDAWGFESSADFAMNFTRNGIVLIHRFVDFGRVFVLLFVGIALLRRGISKDGVRVRSLLIMGIFSTLVVYGTSLLIRNPMSHLYYLPSFLAFSLLAFVLLEPLPRARWVYAFLLSMLLLGNAWVYPDRMAQGWDASLAHLPYWPLRAQALRYMDEHDISIDSTASFFPNVVAVDDVDVNGDLRAFVPFTGEEDFVFYANVFNLTDEEHALLERSYYPLQTFQRSQVRVVLYRRKTAG